MNQSDDTLDKLLANYRFWGLVATGSFFVFIFLFLAALYAQKINFMTLLIILLSGLLWIGTTSISRHSFILLKQYIGSKVGIAEFLATQLVFFLFPFAYWKVKREVASYREKSVRGE